MRSRRPREGVPEYRPSRVAWLYGALRASRFGRSGRIVVKRLSCPRNRARSRARVEPAASDARDAGTEKQGCYQGLPGLQAPQTSHRLRTAGGFCRLLVPRLPGELFPPMACRKPRSLQAATRLLSRAPRTPPRLQLRVPTPPTRGHAGAEAEGEARAFTVERRGGSPRRRRQCPRFSV